MRLSEKQKAYWREEEHRWMVKCGATRSGKTYLDYFLIPRRIRARRSLPGSIVLIGHNRGTIKRNVLEPMQAIYGEDLVSNIAPDGSCMLFGVKAYCLGADNRRAVDRLRGMSVSYCYGDEVVSWQEEVFEMLKSRLDKPYSCFDGTCNPAWPDHWFKRFLDSDADIFLQQYTLFDNPFLDPAVRSAIAGEYRGVYYDRYVLGKWALAEGLVFPDFARDPSPWLCDAPCGGYEKVVIGIDFGGYQSRTCMTALGFTDRYGLVTALAENALPVRESVDAMDIAGEYVRFYRYILSRFGRVDCVLGDSASPTMINTLVSAARSEGLPWRMIGPCRKNDVSQRPLTVDRLLGQRRLLIDRGCAELIRALSHLRWDPLQPDRPEDKNLANINDSYDSFCYAFLPFSPFLERQAVPADGSLRRTVSADNSLRGGLKQVK